MLLLKWKVKLHKGCREKSWLLVQPFFSYIPCSCLTKVLTPFRNIPSYMLSRNKNSGKLPFTGFALNNKSHEVLSFWGRKCQKTLPRDSGVNLTTVLVNYIAIPWSLMTQRQIYHGMLPWEKGTQTQPIEIVFCHKQSAQLQSRMAERHFPQTCLGVGPPSFRMVQNPLWDLWLHELASALNGTSRSLLLFQLLHFTEELTNN